MATTSFGDDMVKWAKKVGKTTDQACRGVKLGILSNIVLNTRVDTGRARGNWNVSDGSPDMSISDATDKGGGATISKGMGEIKAFSKTYISNNLPYIEVLEEKDGMVATTLARAERIVRESVAEAKE